MAINLESILNQARSQPQSPVRESALARLQQIGWPRSRHEYWTFFPLSAFSRQNLAENTDHSSPVLTGSNDLSAEQDVAALLPLALSSGSHSHQIANASAEDVIQNVIQITLSDSSAHHVIRLARGSRGRLLIAGNPDAPAFQAHRLDIVCEEDAELELLFTQDTLRADQLELCHLHLIQEAASRVHILDLHAGQGTYRGSIQADLRGAGASFAYRALSMVHQDSHSHRHLTVNHQAPECSSTQFVRHILTERAQASLDGSVVVSQYCANTASEQLVNSLLLSPDTRVATKPNLKIFHDNVECSHGSTCSDLDSDSLFYLESRGLHPEQARHLLTEAFALEVAEAHPAGELRSAFLKSVQTALTRIAL